MSNLFINIILFLHLNNTPIIIGHRGARGLYPENTIEGFKLAIKNGVTMIEFDVVITADSQVVVSHDPWFNHKFCSEPEGQKVKRSGQHNIYKMKYADVKKYDCGKRGHPDFPQQKKDSAFKPLLKDMISELEKYCGENNFTRPIYLLEIKSRKISDNKYHPVPKKFAKLVYDVINAFHINDRFIIQSFDQRPLKEIHKLDSKLKIGLLVIRGASVNKKIKQLGFIPYAYNPNHKFIKKKTIDEAHRLGTKIFVWTVNSEKEIQKLVRKGADGIITDYPNLSMKPK